MSTTHIKADLLTVELMKTNSKSINSETASNGTTLAERQTAAKKLKNPMPLVTALLQARGIGGFAKS